MLSAPQGGAALQSFFLHPPLQHRPAWSSPLVRSSPVDIEAMLLEPAKVQLIVQNHRMQPWRWWLVDASAMLPSCMSIVQG